MKKLLLAIVFLGAACGGGASAEPEPAAAPTPTPSAADQTADTQSPTTEVPVAEPETTEAPVDEPVASAPGGITLTIGDETWEFDGALCAYENAPPGEDGSEWNVSLKQGDLQVYASVDSFGDQVSLTDVVNYGTFEWVAEGGDITFTIDGNDITAEGTFTDNATGLPAETGTFTATCASWYSG